MKDGHLLYSGESIELSAENSRNVAAAVADMRRELAAAKDAATPLEIPPRLETLDNLFDSVIREFRQSPGDNPKESDRIGLTCVVYRLHHALGRLRPATGWDNF